MLEANAITLSLKETDVLAPEKGHWVDGVTVCKQCPAMAEACLPTVAATRQLQSLPTQHSWLAVTAYSWQDHIRLASQAACHASAPRRHAYTIL